MLHNCYTQALLMPTLVSLANVQQLAAVNLTSDPGRDPGAVTIPSTAEIGVHWVTASLVGASIIWHASYSGVFNGTIAQANSILTGLTSGANWTAFAAFINNQAGISAVTIRDVNTRDNAPIQSTGAGVLGTSASPALPDETAAVVTLRTARAGKQNRGRSYVPGWATNALGAGNIIAPTAVTALNNWASIWAGVMSAQGYTFGVGHFHRLAYTSLKTGVSYPERPAGLVPIINVVVRDNHWDSQRRRGLK